MKAKLLAALGAHGVASPRVLRALGRVPRERFVPQPFREHVWENVALPIGRGQTISQPEVVAIMTDALNLAGRHRVLEIGTGSGFQTAVLAQLCRWVYSMERHGTLLKEAQPLLEELGVTNVTLRHGDGARGWPEQAPFDRILVTAAAEHEVPPALLEQLAVGGLLVAPVARSTVDQRLVALHRREQGYEMIDLGAVRFVPLISEAAPVFPGGTEPVTRALTRLRRAR